MFIPACANLWVSHITVCLIVEWGGGSNPASAAFLFDHQSYLYDTICPDAEDFFPGILAPMLCSTELYFFECQWCTSLHDVIYCCHRVLTSCLVLSHKIFHLYLSYLLQLGFYLYPAWSSIFFAAYNPNKEFASSVQPHLSCSLPARCSS